MKDSYEYKNQIYASQKPYIIFWYVMVILLITFVGNALLKSNGNAEKNLFYLCWIGNSLMVYSIYTWKRINGNLFSSYIFFLISFFTFTYGQAFLRSIGIIHEPFDLYRLYSTETLLQAHFYTILGLSFMHLGALCTQKRKIREQEIFEIQDESLNKSIKVIAWGLFILSAFIYFYKTGQNMVQSLTYGYMSLYNYNNNDFGNNISFMNNVVLTIKLFFIPAIFLLIVIYKKNKTIRNLMVSILIAAVFINFAAGARSDAAALLVSFMVLWHEQIKIFKGKTTVVILIGAILLLCVFNIIGEIRGNEGRNINDIVQQSIEIISSRNPVIGSIGEMGGSMFPLIEMMQLVPNNFDFKYGETYLAALLAIFPNFLTGDIIDRVSLSNWLMSVLNMNYGPGFSLLAEAYYNFSWIGVTFMFLLGFLIAKILNPFKGNSDQIALSKIFVAVMLYFLITASRGDSLLLIRYEVYYVLVPYISINLLRKYFR